MKLWYKASMKKLSIIFYVFLSFSSACLGQMKAEVTNGNWGGYWWSMNDGETVLGWNDEVSRKVWTPSDIKRFTVCLDEWSQNCDVFSNLEGSTLSPLMKFDLYVRKLLEEEYQKPPLSLIAKSSQYELNIHYIGNNKSHPHWEAKDYAGKCIGWALASIDYNEPAIEKNINGILFKPADIKALLSTLYNGAQFFVPTTDVVGEAYRDAASIQKDYDDVLPKEFILALQKNIGQLNKALVADLEPADGVWNHPIFGYEVKIQSRLKNKIRGYVKIKYANDEVEIDSVFSNKTKRIDHLTRTLKFEAEIPDSWVDNNFEQIVNSKWVGQSVEFHPDSLVLGLENNWKTEINKYKNTNMKNEVNFQLFKKIYYQGQWIRPVDKLLNDYFTFTP